MHIYIILIELYNAAQCYTCILTWIHIIVYRYIYSLLYTLHTEFIDTYVHFYGQPQN